LQRSDYYLFCAGDGEVPVVAGALLFVFVAAPVLVLSGALLLLCGAASPCAGEAVSAGAVVAAGEGCCGGAVVGSAGASCRTERVPVSPGKDSIRATNMKRAAAPMVILASSVCVPRGPKAVLETLLEKSAPASALPGCKSTATTSTIHDRINNPYKI
jgi:hypothetical protein